MPRTLFLVAALSATSAHAESVNITTTSYGIPHVKAKTMDGAGYGLGWAFARDNACELLEEVVTTRGERSIYFGPSEKIYDIFTLTGGKYDNIISDTYHRWLFGPHAAKHQIAGMNKDVRALSNGYVNGFNAWVRANPDKLAKTCRGKPWVRPIALFDIGIRNLKFATRSSTSYFAEGLGSQSPGTDVAAPAKISALSGPRSGTDLGSNMAAFGRDMTGGGSLHFANPHFPWLGIERIWMMHVTVPGKIDVMGGALHGMPLPGVGFNAHQAWSLTWADNQRALYHELSLAPDDPTAYIVDGKTVKMIRRVIKVPVGNGITRDRIVYETPWGPVLQAPILPWTKTNAYVISDANRENNRFANFLYGLAKARTVAEVKASSAATLGNAISNVISADAEGSILYANHSVTPDVSDALTSKCGTTPFSEAIRAKFNITVFDASRSECTTPKNQGRISIIPAERLPTTVRSDYLVHSNNAHEIVNADPKSHLTGYADVIGLETQALGERTRRALQIAEQRRTGSDGLPGTKMDADAFEALFWQSRSVLSHTMLPDILADCKANPAVKLPTGEAVDLTKACAVLTTWDRTDRLDSVGSHIFGRMLRKLPKLDNTGGITMPADYWRVTFDPANPIDTPRGLKVDDRIRFALAKTVKELNDAKIPLDAPLRQIQFVERGGKRLPLSGGAATYNQMYTSIKAGVGLTDPIPFADSYMHLVTFTKNGPEARGLLAYSQSTDPDSIHSYDQTEVFSQQRLVPLPFTAAQIAADPSGTTITLDTNKR
jgi:acyl-homoserine-lactone acylase